MRKLMFQLSVLVSLAFPLGFSGCGGSTPMPGSSSPSSEEADAAGGMNKSGEKQPAGEPGKAAENTGDEGKASAAEDKPAEPKAEGETKG